MMCIKDIVFMQGTPHFHLFQYIHCEEKKILYDILFSVENEIKVYYDKFLCPYFIHTICMSIHK